MSRLQKINMSDMAQRINAMHREASKAAVTAVELAIEIGGILIDVKAELPHGEFGPWIEKNCEFSDRTARGYMRLAKAVPSLDESKRQRVADLPLRGALAELVDKPEATPTENAVIAAIPHHPQPINTELTEDEQESIRRLAEPFGAMSALADEWREQQKAKRKNDSHQVTQPAKPPIAEEEITEAEYREITPKPASTNPTLVNCGSQEAHDMMRQSIDAAVAANSQARQADKEPSVSRNQLLRDAARLMKRAANGEEITRDEATGWLSVFDAWSREIGMEDDTRGSHD